MAKRPVFDIVNVGYRSTNYWVVSSGRARLLVDIGWPGTMGEMSASLRRADVPLHEISAAFATHYHIDHAGLAQELKKAGVSHLVFDVQIAAVPLMKRWTKPQDGYVEITIGDSLVVPVSESRGALEELGIRGEVLHTPGHSDDSVSLLLDDGSAFTGDLTHPSMVGEHDVTVVASWQLLRNRGAKRIYPAHGPVRRMDAGLPRASASELSETSS